MWISITPFSALFLLFLFSSILYIKYEGLTSMIIKFMVHACYATHYNLTVVCPAVGKIFIVFKWARSMVKIFSWLCVYQLVKKKIIFYSTSGHLVQLNGKVLLWYFFEKNHDQKRQFSDTYLEDDKENLTISI